MNHRTKDVSQLILLSYRAPYRYERNAAGQLHEVRASSGVVNAVEPLLLETGGVWVAAADPHDGHQPVTARSLAVPLTAPRYRLRQVPLTSREHEGFYFGAANGALWPLCHRTGVMPRFLSADFTAYERVNRAFAAAVCDETREPAPIVLVHDYHFALAPEMIRAVRPESRIATFWHVPWPSPATFSRCPWADALLAGLLGSTSIGFQTPVDRDNFLRSVEHVARVDSEAHVVSSQGRRVRVEVCPASIAWPGDLAASAPSIAKCRAEIRRNLHLPDDVALGVGVDRLDYTKGIEEKLLAIERLLECRPDLRHRLVFVQIAEPSRESLTAYRITRERVLAAAERINARFPGGPPPIVLLLSHHSQSAIARYMRAADFCYVGSLHDGMNLVSKEFVAARDDEGGVLVLSAGAGASYELRDALIVNPHDIDQVARTIAAALEMPMLQQRYRMRRLRRVVAEWDASRWATRILETVSTVIPVPAKPFDRNRAYVSL